MPSGRGSPASSSGPSAPGAPSGPPGSTGQTAPSGQTGQKALGSIKMEESLRVPESPLIQIHLPSPPPVVDPSSRLGFPPAPRISLGVERLARLLESAEEGEAAARVERELLGGDGMESVGEGEDRETSGALGVGVVLKLGLRWAVERADLECVSWLVGLSGDRAKMLDDQVHTMEDEDGHGLTSLALQSTSGHQETEEIVRLIVSRWGVDIGPRNGADRNGWTALHLASLISTPPLVSFLLNRGADPGRVNSKGLTALDLVSGIPDRLEVAVFLESSARAALEREGEAPGGGVVGQAQYGTASLGSRRQAMLSRRRAREAEKLGRMDEEDRKWRVRLERERWVRDMASIVQVSPQLLLPEPRRRALRHVKRPEDMDEDGHGEEEGEGEGGGDEFGEDDSGMGDMDDMIDELASEAEAEAGYSSEEESATDDEGIHPQIPTANDTMLVFSLVNLPAIFDILITSYRPVCTPLDKRSLPANTIYLHARFAHYKCDETWLEELVEGAVERIEQGVYSNSEDLAYLAFWAYNTTLLLHLIRSDEGLGEACGELGLSRMVEELINAIHVFVIRVTERKIDEIFDAALLDYESLEDFNDVRFEGEWSLFRSFTGRKKIINKTSQMFASPSASPSSRKEDNTTSSPSSLFGALRDNVAAASPLKKTLVGKGSVSSLSMANSRSVSIDSLATVGGKDHPTADLTLSPKQVTDILSSVLMVLQLYEVNPAVTIQAISQVFFWISCEIFNKVLTRRKYLCRSKAVQIRMNITTLEDWVRAKGLPLKTATKHFEPANQLLRWLQCLSQVREFDTLIGTMQSLKAINPLQMRRAVREYRYEVNEGRMTDECAQYLSQLQKDWEKRRVQIGADAIEAQRRGSFSTAATTATDGTVDDSTPIDTLFDGTTALADFVPRSAPECLGELLDTRYMLPFDLPSDTEYLVATPPSDAAFAHAPIPSILSPSEPGSRSSRPASVASFSSSRPMGRSVPRPSVLRRLPNDFFKWFKEAESARLYHRQALIPPRVTRDRPSPMLALDPPGPGQEQGLESVMEGEDPTPIAAVHPPVSPSSSTWSPGTGLGFRATESLDRLREQARTTFETVERPLHTRQDSYELRQRPVPSPIISVQSAPGERYPLGSTPSTPVRITPHSAPLWGSPSPAQGQSPDSGLLSPAGVSSPRQWFSTSPTSGTRRASGDSMLRH